MSNKVIEVIKEEIISKENEIEELKELLKSTKKELKQLVKMNNKLNGGNE